MNTGSCNFVCYDFQTKHFIIILVRKFAYPLPLIEFIFIHINHEPTCNNSVICALRESPAQHIYIAKGNSQSEQLWLWDEIVLVLECHSCDKKLCSFDSGKAENSRKKVC